MLDTLIYSGRLVITRCWCGIHLAVPEELNDLAKRRGQKIYCPVGHSFVYNDTTTKQLERALERERATRELLSQEERSHTATRGHLTRKRRELARVARGVCPCCSRSFANVERHMRSQHPDFGAQEESAA